jgi:hypothetical protein
VAALVRRFRSPLQVFAFLEVPIALAVALGWHVYGHGGGYDFAIFRRAGQAVLHGHTPFVQPTFELIAANNRWVYPTPFAIPFVPFALVPEELAAVLFLVLSLAALVASLWLLGVRDWRCYGVSLLGVPVFGGLSLETIGPFLLLLCALGWRYRSRTVAGVPLALAAAAKLFLWPVLLWLLITRRFRAFAAAVATIAATVVVWAIVDPGGMSRYPETVHLLNAVQRWKSYSVQSLFISLHFSAPTSEFVAALATVAVFNFLWSWNDLFGPLIYLNSQDKMTVTQGLTLLVGRAGTGGGRWGIIMAGALLGVIPVLVLYFLGQKYFVQGLARTGLKG